MPDSPVVVSAFRMTPSLARALCGGPVRVGTRNPAKLGAVRAALAALATPATLAALRSDSFLRSRSGAAPSDLDVVGVGAESGVPEQPVGWDEIVAGARQRAEAALASGSCELAFGIEDGLVALPVPSRAVGAGATTEADSTVFNLGCAWVTDGERSGTGFSSGFAYPPAVSRPAWAERAPIGELFDALWARHRAGRAGPASDPGGGAVAVGAGDPLGPSGRQGGNIGQLTQGRLDRSAYGAQAILCALVPFLHADLYD